MGNNLKILVLYTHQLYIDGLGSNRPVLLTSWMKGRLSRPHIDLFPKKFVDGFAGHRFSVAAAEQPPYVFKKYLNFEETPLCDLIFLTFN